MKTAETMTKAELKNWLFINTNEYFINSNLTVFVAVKGECDTIDSKKARLFESLKHAVKVCMSLQIKL